jgi:hypothetical protein
LGYPGLELSLSLPKPGSPNQLLHTQLCYSYSWAFKPQKLKASAFQTLDMQNPKTATDPTKVKGERGGRKGRRGERKRGGSMGGKEKE